MDDGTEVCAVSGKRFPRREMINYEGKWISAEHRDAFFQRQREGVAQVTTDIVPGPFGYGNFGRRFAARLIDSVILNILGRLAGFLLGLAMGSKAAATSGPMGLATVGFAALGVGMIINAIYEIVFLAKFGATPGKLALGLKVVRPDGSNLTAGRAAGRYFATILSALPLCIGYIMAGFDDERRSLHDRICDTRVIKIR